MRGIELARVLNALSRRLQWEDQQHLTKSTDSTIVHVVSFADGKFTEVRRRYLGLIQGPRLPSCVLRLRNDADGTLKVLFLNRLGYFVRHVRQAQELVLEYFSSGLSSIRILSIEKMSGLELSLGWARSLHFTLNWGYVFIFFDISQSKMMISLSGSGFFFSLLKGNECLAVKEIIRGLRSTKSHEEAEALIRAHGGMGWAEA